MPHPNWREAAKALRRSDPTAASDLAGGLAHDVNNRMSAILLCATELLAELPSNTESALLASEITEAACEVADFCDQLMGYASAS